ncbi:MAG: tRNA (adenosine(37)-N6)-dimethylallyltransferase MiaA [Actinobacteria bacterium]|nr:MAG: tRNA (adenosine(37)-N6)-dimethylallyltransferase MiaA [Actinomycetota bacterium]
MNRPAAGETPPVLAIVGATGTGKSELSLDLAEQLDGEIVNADSMQVYRGMDIGTAKLPARLRRGIDHHLLDIWDVRAAANVAEYQRRARAAIGEVHGRGRLPILVGGSGLYVWAALRDLRFPGHDPAVRAELEAVLAEAGPEALHRQLAAVDPPAAAAILPGNGRRIVRALEVIAITGQPFAAALGTPEPVFRTLTIGLTMERARLDQRLDARVDRMWADGLVDEVRNLPGLPDSPTAGFALGYRQVLDHLAGRCSDAEARAATARGTRKFARRQEAWFRRDRGTLWIAAGEADTTSRAQIAAQPFRLAEPGA